MVPRFKCPLRKPEPSSRLTADVQHRPGWRHEAGLHNVMPLFLAADCTMDKLHQFVVRGATTHEPVQIMIPD